MLAVFIFKESCSCLQKLLNHLSRREAEPPEDNEGTRAAMERSPAWVSTKITLARNTCEPKHLPCLCTSCRASEKPNEAHHTWDETQLLQVHIVLFLQILVKAVHSRRRRHIILCFRRFFSCHRTPFHQQSQRTAGPLPCPSSYPQPQAR